MNVNTYLKSEEIEKLRSVRIGIGGAGGLGSNAAAHLVRAGVEQFVIADFDTVCEQSEPPVFLPRPARDAESGSACGKPAAHQPGCET